MNQDWLHGASDWGSADYRKYLQDYIQKMGT